jgi:hypothetical protein
MFENKPIRLSETAGSHGGEYEDNSLVGYSTCSFVHVSWRFGGPYSLHYADDHLPNNAVSTSETSVYFNETTLRCIPEGCHLKTNK